MNDFISLITPEFALVSFIAWVGLALHLAMKWQEAREACSDHEGHSDLTFRKYVNMVPAQTSVAILASVGTFTVAYAVDWMNPGMSFACGYMGSSIAENMAGRFGKIPPK